MQERVQALPMTTSHTWMEALMAEVEDADVDDEATPVLCVPSVQPLAGGA